MGRLLEGKIAIVTGAAHGIGRGHALELAGHGATVVVADLGTSVSGEGAGQDADEVVALITESGGTAVADYADIADETQAAALVERTVREFGRLDIVNDEKRWDATTLGMRIATDLFRTRAPGLR